MREFRILLGVKLLDASELEAIVQEVIRNFNEKRSYHADQMELISTDEIPTPV